MERKGVKFARLQLLLPPIGTQQLHTTSHRSNFNRRKAMDYRTGTIGRVLTIRFDDGDDFLTELVNLVKKENIRNGWFQVIGGIREIDLVIGPKEPVMPPDPVWHDVRNARETLGSGSIFWDENDEPKIHLHAALGHHGETITGCLRKGSKTYLILEVILFEITGFEADRPWDATKGFNILTFH